MSRRRCLPAFAVALAIVVWAIPLQLGVYADSVITDIPTYQRAYDLIAGGQRPVRRLQPRVPAARGRRSSGWRARCPGPYGVTFSILMLGVPLRHGRSA